MIFDVLKEYNIDTIMSSLVVAAAFVYAVYKVIVFIKGVIKDHDAGVTKQNSEKERINECEKQISELNNTLSDIESKIDSLTKLLEDNVESQKIILRGMIVDSALDALDKREIEAYKLQKLEDLYIAYTSLNGNYYVLGLMKKVRHLDVTTKHGEVEYDENN